jgi:hypothetical protein
MMFRLLLFVFWGLSPLFSFSQKVKNKTPLFPIFTTYFESGQWTLTEPQMENLRTYVVSNIRTIKDSNYCIQVCGHTDESGYKKINVVLSRKRAVSVSEFIIKNGISEKKIKSLCLECKEHDDLFSSRTKYSGQKNHTCRCVVVRIDKEN